MFKMKTLLLLSVLVLLNNSSFQRVYGSSSLDAVSSPSSWIGQGQVLHFTNVSAQVTYDLGVYSDSVQLSAGGYSLTIVGPGLTLPTVGMYSNATRWPFMGAGAGMAFTGPGRGDNTLTGYFDVLQADYDNYGQVAAFAVDFVQYDEGNLSRWNNGSIRYNSDFPVPEPSAIFMFVIGLGVLCLRAGARYYKRSGA